MRIFIAALLAFLTAQPASSQSFSCRIGTQPACLDYGDKVCSSFAKCVDESAQCFNSYQCNYEGFTCKSNVTECVDDYNGLLERNNALVDDYNDLLKRHKKLVTDYNDVLGDYETLRNEASKLDSEHSDLKDCVGYADDLEDAQDCAW